MAEEGQDTQDGGEVDEQLLQEAKEMGWSDRDQWHGKPEDWVDAATFVERGRHILPIVQEHNKRLRGELQQVGGRLQSLENALQGANAALEALQESHDDDVKAQVEAARSELRSELEQASRDGDHKGVAELTDKLVQLNRADDSSSDDDNGKGKGKKDQQPPARLAPEFIAWANENQDFMRDPRRVALANVISAELREKGETAIGKPFLDMVAAEVDNTLGYKGRGGTSRVSSGNGGGRDAGGGGGGVTKTYADLPAEAKAACDKMEKRLVGPNRKHKDQKSWRESYTKQFFGGQS